MKQLVFIIMILSLFVACKEKPKNPVAEYGDAMINAYNRGKAGGETANLNGVRQAVQAYHASNDKYPQNLEEVKPLIGSEVDFSKYDYDPQTGAVNLKSK